MRSSVPPQVKFVKDSSGSADYRRHFVEVKRARPELTLLTGGEFDVVPAIARRLRRLPMGTGILNAGLIGRALDALAAGDTAAAHAWQQRSNDIPVRPVPTPTTARGWPG